MTTTSEKVVLDVEDVAKLFGISSRHVKRLSASGDFPSPIRLGKRIKWLKKDLEEWIANGCVRVRRREERGGS